MLVSTSIPLVRQSVPHRARVEAIYATACLPYTGQPVRVLVEAIRQVNILSQNGEPPYLVADIRVPFAPLGFGVRLKSLSNLSAFVSLEV